MAAIASSGDLKTMYNSWRAMKARCSGSGHVRYYRYGGRGISVCDAWSLFSGFKDWALTNGWSCGMTIDRIDSNGNYEPENCRWVPLSDNSRSGCGDRKLRGGYKLSYDDASRVKNLAIAGDMSDGDIAKIFGVSRALVWRVIHGKAWHDAEPIGPVRVT